MLDALREVRKRAREYDEKNKARPPYVDEKGFVHLAPVPSLEMVDRTIARKLTYIPDFRVVEFLLEFLEDTPYQQAKAEVPYRLIECVQDERVEEILKKLIFHHEDAYVCQRAIMAYSVLKGFDADDYLKRVVIRGKDKLRQIFAIQQLGWRGYVFGPFCKAEKVLNYLARIDELSHLDDEINKALGEAKRYHPAHFYWYLCEMDRHLSYWNTFHIQSRPQDYAWTKRVRMSTVDRERTAKAKIALYHKYFQYWEKVAPSTTEEIKQRFYLAMEELEDSSLREEFRNWACWYIRQVSESFR
jgi:hypothetical protein